MRVECLYTCYKHVSIIRPFELTSEDKVKGCMGMVKRQVQFEHDVTKPGALEKHMNYNKFINWSFQGYPFRLAPNIKRQIDKAQKHACSNCGRWSVRERF